MRGETKKPKLKSTGVSPVSESFVTLFLLETHAWGTLQRNKPLQIVYASTPGFPLLTSLGDFALEHRANIPSIPLEHFSHLILPSPPAYHA